jgi:uncharacterized protein with FMN-binding domain
LVSTRAKFAAVVASAGVLGAGWAVGTANGATVTNTNTTTTGTTANNGTWTTSTNNTNTTTTGSTSYKDGTYTGTTVQHRFGSVTVTVTISGGKITNVSAQALDGGDRRSQSIDSQAVPIMKSEVLAANSANVSTISGATYTSGAYITSLQSALAKA